MTDLHAFKEGSWQGEIRACCCEQLRELLALCEHGQTEVQIKQAQARRLRAVKSDSGLRLVKEIRYPKPLDRAALFLGRWRGKMEWRRHVKLYALGLPVPSPLLWASGKDEKGAPFEIFIQEYIPNSFNLAQALRGENQLTPLQRRQAAEAIGKALARFHKAGVRHDDAHPGNILLYEQDGRLDCVITDIKEITRKGSLSWNERVRNLGAWLGGELESIALSTRMRCLRAYLREVKDWLPAFRNESEAMRSVSRAAAYYAENSYAKFWRHRIHKCQRHGKVFHRVKCGAYEGWVRAEWDLPELREALSDPNGLIDSAFVQTLKHTEATTVGIVRLPGLPEPLFIKRYNRKGVYERIKNLFRRSRAMKVWRSGYALELLGIPTPQNVCAIERRSGPLLMESFLLTVWVENGMGLDDFYRARYGGKTLGDSEKAEKSLLEKRVAELFRMLHRRGISHGDLKGRNVLISTDKPAPFHPQYVDLDAMQINPKRFRRSRINDLSRLLFSLYPIPTLRDQLRFFHEYAKGDAVIEANHREWLKAIASRTRRKLKEKGIKA